MTYKKNERNNGLQLFEYNKSSIAFRSSDGKVMVNATQMAKSFGKKPIDWLRTQPSKEYIKTLSKVKEITLADLQQVIKGGNNPGTWLHEDVAIEFARWLNPEFGIWCNDMVKEMILSNESSAHKRQGNFIDARDIPYSTKEFNGIHVRYLFIDGEMWFSINDIHKAIGAATGSGQSAKKLNVKQTLAKKILIFGNTHPAWFVNQLGFQLLAMGSRVLKANTQLKLEFGGQSNG